MASKCIDVLKGYSINFGDVSNKQIVDILTQNFDLANFISFKDNTLFSEEEYESRLLKYASSIPQIKIEKIVDGQRVEVKRTIVLPPPTSPQQITFVGAVKTPSPPQQQPSLQQVSGSQIADDIYKKLGDKTKSENVVLPSEYGKSPDQYFSGINQFLKDNPKGILAFRVNTKRPFTKNFEEQNAIGNPFDWQKYGVEKATKMFIEWLVTGNNQGDYNATPKYRDAIISKLPVLRGQKIYYYKELGSPSHATALDWLINSPDSPFNKQVQKNTTNQQGVSQQVKPENISSKGSDFAKKLTNPYNNVRVVYRGREYKNAEHAYQTWKSGEFNEEVYKEGNKYDSPGVPELKKYAKSRGPNVFSIMVEILTEKLKQNPDLIEGINQRGGLEYIQKSTHNVSGDSFWESTGENKFIEALAQAYKNATSNENQETITQTTTTQQPSLKGYEGGFEDEGKGNLKVEIYKGNWTREEVAKQTDKVFLFGDNTNDRLNTKYIPTSTQAVIRGLPNAIGIDTKKDRGTNEGEPVDLKTFTNHSGGAEGADTVWETVGSEFGLGKQVNYRPEDLDKLTEAELKEVEDAYRKAVEELGRKVLSIKTFAGKLVRRDYLQAKYADSIFAVSTIVQPNEVDPKGYVNKTNKPVVPGGTGYAVQMAIDLGKPVYVFDQSKNKWFFWNNNNFEETETPVLTENFAGIGTREINKNGIQAIRDVYEKTAKSKKNSSYFTDADFPQFKKQVDEAIQKAKDSGKIIVIPEQGIGTGKAMLKEKAPKLFEYLQQELNKLIEESKLQQPVESISVEDEQSNLIEVPEITTDLLKQQARGEAVVLGEIDDKNLKKLSLDSLLENNKQQIQSFNNPFETEEEFVNWLLKDSDDTNTDSIIINPTNNPTEIEVAIKTNIENTPYHLKEAITKIANAFAKNSNLKTFEGSIRRMEEASKIWYPIGVLREYYKNPNEYEKNRLKKYLKDIFSEKNIDNIINRKPIEEEVTDRTKQKQWIKENISKFKGKPIYFTPGNAEHAKTVNELINGKSIQTVKVNQLPTKKVEPKVGDIVEYNGKNYVLRKINSSNFAQLSDLNGVNFSGTPTLDKLNVIGTLPVVRFNNYDFIVTEDDKIISVATGGLKYENQSNERTEILNKARRGESTNNEGSTSSQYELYPGVYANESQRQAINKFKQFLNDQLKVNNQNKVALLKGRGGTGKTTIIKKIIQDLPKNEVMYVAPTHKAKEVLKKAAGVKKAYTLASALGIKLNESTGAFQVDDFARKKGIPVSKYKYIIVDEASMISDSLFYELLAESGNSKIILMGDNAQLPPVGQEKDSVVFDYTLHELTERMRQEESSPILAITDIIANNIQSPSPVNRIIDDSRRTTIFDPATNSGVVFERDLDTVIQLWLEDVKNNPEGTKIITFNNENSDNAESVKSLNLKARSFLFPNETAEFVPGDILTAYDTYIEDELDNDPFIQNSLDYTVLSVTPTRVNNIVTATTKGISRSIDASYDGYVLELKNNLTGEIKEVYVPTIKEKQRLKALEKYYYEVDPQTKNKRDAQMGVKLSQSYVNLEYGYAITSHKSQGSTYRNAYVMEDNILGNIKGTNKSMNQSLYVATSRPSSKLVIKSSRNKKLSPDEINKIKNSSGVQTSHLKIKPAAPLASMIKTMEGKQDPLVRQKYFPTETQKSSVILDKIAKSQHPLNKLAEHLKKYIKSNDVDITIKNELVMDGEFINGWYLPDENIIEISESAILKGVSAETVILHEILHALTYEELRTNTNAVNELRSLYEYAKSTIGEDQLSSRYGLSNLDEFIVGIFTDSRLMKAMMKTPAKNPFKQNLFQEIIDYILSLFKITSNSNLYTQAFYVASQVIEQAYQRSTDLYESVGLPKEVVFDTSQTQYESKPPLYQKEGKEGFEAYEKTIRDLASRLVSRIGGELSFEYQESAPYSGYSEGNKFVINLAKATLDTPIHEILAHPIIAAIKENPKQAELYNNLLKELESGYGKEVLERVKSNYTIKPVNIMFFTHNGIDYTLTLNTYGKNAGKYSLLNKGEESIYSKLEDLPEFVKPYLEKYTLEEHQEEAIVQLLGELTAGKIKDTQENKGLISKLKQLLKEISAYLRSLFNSKEIEISKLRADITLNDLANLLAYTNSKIILPGSEVIYTTPDNKKFKTYAEASYHLSNLIKSIEDVDLKKVKLKTDLSKEDLEIIRELEEKKKQRIDYLNSEEYQREKELKISKLEEELNELKKKKAELFDQEFYLTEEDKENYGFKDFDYVRVESTYSRGGNFHEEELGKDYEGYYIFGYNVSKEKPPKKILPITKEEAKKIWEKDRYSSYNPQNKEKIYNIQKDIDRLRYDEEIRNEISSIEEKINKIKRYSIPIVEFIEKNKEYEMSKEIIEEWKKANDIQYNPEEVYSRGYEFVSVLGAFSKFDVNLMLQNLLYHIEDSEKAGGKFAISAFTKPIDKSVVELEGRGGKIRFKIYPKSEDILWAADDDVVSGSVWDAPEIIDSNIKSELLGVIYTKYPSFGLLNSVQPNLADTIDKLEGDYNELGIVLNGNNFRLEYDEDIPIETKKIVDGINAVLDQRYGKIQKPSFKVSTHEKYRVYLQDSQLPQLSDSPFIEFDTLEKAQKYYKRAKKSAESQGFTLSTPQPVIYKGLPPKHTKSNIKEPIEVTEKRLQNKKVTTPITKEEYEKIKAEEIEFDKWMLKITEDATYWRTKDRKRYEMEETQDFSKRQYTETAEINNKIAALKRVSKKYPRILITSKVVNSSKYRPKYQLSDDTKESQPTQDGIKPKFYLSDDQSIKTKINLPRVPEQQVDLLVNPELVELVNPVLVELNKVGYNAIIVGGAVRDALLGNKPKDIDIEVYGTSLDDLEKTLSRYGKVDAVGKAFGILKFQTYDSTANILQDELPRKGLILPIGISGSGKSTWIQSLPKDNLVVVSPDEIRLELTGDISNQSRNKEVFEIAKQRAAKALSEGRLVVLDATNVNTALRLSLIGDIKALTDFDLYYKIFDADPELSKQRIARDLANQKVRAAVPDNLIDIQYNQYKQSVRVINSAQNLEEPFDFSIPRRENKTGAGYTGFEVEFSKDITIQEAGSRRDFTWNSIGYNPVTKTLYDYYGGINDLAEGIIRHTSPKFAEDPLRILRALQFQARMGHVVAPETYDLMRTIIGSGEFDHLVSEETYQNWLKRKQELMRLEKEGKLITPELINEYNQVVGRIPKERIFPEITKWATKGKYPSKIFDFLRQSGLGDKLYPQLLELSETPQDPVFHPEGDVEEHTKQVLAKANEIAIREKLDAEQKEILMLAALFHDIAKPETTKEEYSEKLGRVKITAKGHEPAGEPKAKAIMNMMGIKKETQEIVGRLIGEHLAHATIASLETDKQKLSAFSKLVERLKPANIKQLMMLMEADMLGRNNANSEIPVSIVEFDRLNREYQKINRGGEFKPLVTGKYLISLGIKPGKELGSILAAAKEAQLNLDITNESEALEWIYKTLTENKFAFDELKLQSDLKRERELVNSLPEDVSINITYDSKPNESYRDILYTYIDQISRKFKKDIQLEQGFGDELFSTSNGKLAINPKFDSTKIKDLPVSSISIPLIDSLLIPQPDLSFVREFDVFKGDTRDDELAALSNILQNLDKYEAKVQSKVKNIIKPYESFYQTITGEPLSGTLIEKAERDPLYSEHLEKVKLQLIVDTDKLKRLNFIKETRCL